LTINYSRSSELNFACIIPLERLMLMVSSQVGVREFNCAEKSCCWSIRLYFGGRSDIVAS